MDNSITWAEKLTTGYNLVDLGYRDYIAARVLLNKHLIIRGLTLASTAVEKYLKAVIVFNLQKKERYHFHLDKLELLKKLLIKINNDVTKEFDPLFLEILQNAFRIRYYDNLKDPIFIGLYINQFIGELDFTVDLIEKHIAITQNGGKSFSAYARAITDNDQTLYENNFILNKVDKKLHMEKPDIGFSIYVYNRSPFHDERIVKGGVTKNIYDGQISTFSDFNEDLYLNYKPKEQ